MIEDVDISTLVNDPANVRTHDRRNLDAIKGSLAKFGQQKPIVIDAKGVVIAGNGTLAAARELGWQKIAVVRSDLAGVEATAYAIADNRTAELAAWDGKALAETIAAIQIEDEDLAALLDFPQADLDTLIGMADAKEVVEDEVPEPPPVPITKPGDLWLLGDHRLLCGDSTKAEDVARLMGGARADLLLTDPPYNVAYAGGSKKRDAIANDKMSDIDFRAFLVNAFVSAFEVMKPGASFYIWHADTEGYAFRGAVIDCSQVVRQCLIWSKDNSMFSRQDYHWKHEPCLYGWKEGAAHGWYSDRKQTTVLTFQRPSRSDEHPTMKPVALFAYLMGNSTAPQGLAYDPFLGSGTTLIAAEQLGRRCYGIEISPQYVDVCVARWEKLTGKQATLGTKKGG